MAAKTRKRAEESRTAKARPAARGVKRDGTVAAVAVVIIIVAAVLISALVYDMYRSNSGVPLSTFLSNMHSANHINIFVSDTNNSVYVNTTYCATSLIYEIESNKNLHRNASSIDFFITNSINSSCTYSVGLSSASNFTTSTLPKCVAMADGVPSIFINYSSTNGTRVTNDALYVYGDERYLGECGISAEVR